MRRNYINQAVNAVKKKLFRLVAVKLHNFTAEISGEITQIHRFEKKVSNKLLEISSEIT